jgi:pimeloyl-ACP methyl ester carboxylesterase
MNYMFTRFILLLILASFLYGCSSSVSIGGYTTENSDGDTLKFYLAQKDYKSPDKNNKLLVLIQGSGRESISRRFEWSANILGMGYDVLFMEKYAFDDSVKFNLTNCRERRINDINFILQDVNKNIYKNKIKDILLFADSEGGDLAPEIACENNLVKRMIIIGNGGMSGTEKIKILLEREKKFNYPGYLTLSGIEKPEDIDSLLNEIKNNPTTEKRFLGASYKYWNSYIFYDVDSFYDKITIPTLVIIGEKDMSVPPESVTHIKEKYKNRSNFSCYIIPDLNHNLIDSKGNKQFRNVLKDYVYPWFKRTAE